MLIGYEHVFEKWDWTKYLINILKHNCPQRKIAPSPGQGWGLGQGEGQFQSWSSTRQLPPEEKCPPVSVRVWLRISFGVGGQFSSGEIVLETYQSSNTCALTFVSIFSFHRVNNYFHQMYLSGKIVTENEFNKLHQINLIISIKKSLEVNFNRSKIFLLRFYDAYDVNL